MVLKTLTLIALLVALPVCAQDQAAGNQPGNAIPVRCVNTLGTLFESCGGSGAAGTDVNISGVGGTALAPGGPISVNFTNTTLAVTGTFFQATQPVSLASVPSHDVTNAGTFAVQATGTVTANAGSNLNTSLLTTEATLLLIKAKTDNLDPRSATATTTQVADTAASTTLLASNANRLGASVFNDSSATLYLKLGTTASLTDYTTKIVSGAYYEVPFRYTGRIDGIWATDPNDGAARITELT